MEIRAKIQGKNQVSSGVCVGGWREVVRPKKTFVTPNPTTCVSFLRPTWHKEKTTLQVVPWPPCECRGMCACTGKHLQLTPSKNKTPLMTAGEANDVSKWEHLFCNLYCCFLSFVCLESTSPLTKAPYSLTFWQKHSPVLRAEVGKATSLESTY